MSMTSAARTAAFADVAVIHRSHRDGANTGRTAHIERICCRKRVCQSGQGGRRCGIQADIADSQRTAGQTRSVLSCKNDICGAESAGENDASTAA